MTRASFAALTVAAVFSACRGDAVVVDDDQFTAPPAPVTQQPPQEDTPPPADMPAPVTPAPVITDIALTTAEDTAISATLSTLAATVTSQPTSGTLSVTAGMATYTPNANFFGTDSFTFKVNDGALDSNEARVTITVTPVNDPPTLTLVNTLQTMHDVAVTLQLSDFAITDVDSTTGFTLAVTADSNATTTGATIVPKAGYVGPVQLSITVSDGELLSAPIDATLIVANQTPAIAGQLTIPTIAEDDPAGVTITPAMINAVDPDSAVLSLAIACGADCTTNGLTVHPRANFNGTLTLASVTVDDGFTTSAAFTGFTITVTPVNDSPIVHSTINRSTAIGVPLSLSLADVVADDTADNDAIASLQILAGSNYAPSGDTIVPDAGFEGTLAVGVTVTDTRGDVSAIATISVSIANTAPTVTQSTIPSIQEGSSYALQAADVTVVDPDAGQSHTLRIVGVTGPTFTPQTNFFGRTSIFVAASDGALESTPVEFFVDVQNVNDAPVIVGPTGTGLATALGEPFSISLANIEIEDVDGETAFSLFVVAASGFTAATGPSGTWIIDPDDTNLGPLSIPVYVTDAIGAASNQQTLTAVVANDIPEIVAQTNAFEVTAEDMPLTITTAMLQIADDNSAVQTFSVELLENTDSPGLYTVTGGNTLVPALNFNNAPDTFDVWVRVSDGVATSPVFTSFKVSVTASEDAPTLAHNVPETQPTTSVGVSVSVTSSMFIANDADGQALSIVLDPGANYSVGASGSVIPQANFAGTLSVPVRVRDTTGRESNTVTLTVVVQNHNPSATQATPVPLHILEDQDFTLTAAMLTIDSGGDQGETFAVGVAAGSGPYTLSGGSTIRPAQDYTGPISLSVRVTDGLGGQSASIPFSIIVDNVNDAPTPQPKTYAANGNAGRVGEPGLLAGASDVDNAQGDLRVVAASGASTLNGSYTVYEDGTFDYTPPAHARAAFTDSFPYQVTDGLAVGTASVTINNILPFTWWVDNRYAGTTSDGRKATPFKTLPAAEAASDVGDTIVIAGGGTNYVITDPFVLDASQTVLGTANPVIQSTAATPTITLGNSTTTISGITVLGAGTGIQGADTANLVLTDVSVTNAGRAAINFDKLSGAATFTRVTVTGAAGAALRVVNTSKQGALTLQDTSLAGANGLVAQKLASLSVSTADNLNLSASNGPALSLTDVDGSINVQNMSSAGGQQGLVLDTFNGTLQLQRPTTLSNATVAAVSIQSSNVTFSATSLSVTPSSGAIGLRLNNNTSASAFTVALASDIATTNARGISAVSGGTINLSGNYNVAASGNQHAVYIDGVRLGTVSAVNLSASGSGAPGTLFLRNTGSGGSFTAQDVTLTASGAGCDAGVRIENVNAPVTLRTVNVNNCNYGVFLKDAPNTFFAGRAGGSRSFGGRFQAIGIDGINLSGSLGALTFESMTIDPPGRNGVFLSDTSTLLQATFNHGHVEGGSANFEYAMNFGISSGAPRARDGIALNDMELVATGDTALFMESAGTGLAAATGFTGPTGPGNTVAPALAINNSNISFTESGSGVVARLNASGKPGALAVTIANTTLAPRLSSLTPTGAGVDVAAFGIFTGPVSLSMTGCTLTTNAGFGDDAILFRAGVPGTHRFNLSNNAVNGWQRAVVSSLSGANGTLLSTIAGNSIGLTTAPLSDAVTVALDASTSAVDLVHRATIDNNQIRFKNNTGIYAHARNGSASGVQRLVTTVTNNSVQATGAALEAMSFQSEDNASLCTLTASNTALSAPAQPGIVVRELDSSLLQIAGFTGTDASPAGDAASYLNGQNVLTVGANVTSTVSPSFRVTGVSQCP